jgi:hypothetical protein
MTGTPPPFGFLHRLIVHAEWRRGYRPHFSIRRAPRHGDRTRNGDEHGSLLMCHTCSGVGYLFESDELRDAAPATASPRTYDQLTEQEGGPPNERIGEDYAPVRECVRLDPSECVFHGPVVRARNAARPSS